MTHPISAVTRAQDEYIRTYLAHVARTRAHAARAARAAREDRENEYEHTRTSVRHAATASANARWKKLGQVRDHRYGGHERVAGENIVSLRRRSETQAHETARKAHEAARKAREADEASWARHRTRQSRFYR